MAVVASAPADTERAFDAVASSYHRANSENPLLCAMRDRTRAALERAAAPGSHILNLGCGPGTDDVYFAARGFYVTAIDSSPAMVAEARRRVREGGHDDRVRVERLGIQELATLRTGGFDAAYSSFGALNCVPDLDDALRRIAGQLRPGGVLVASVIGRVCPWEIALYASRGQWARAAVRFSKGPVAVPLEGRTVWTRYYTIREFGRASSAAGFERIAATGLGLMTPPPYLESFARRHPHWIGWLQRLEDAVASWPLVRAAGDHFLTVQRRV